MRARLRNTAEGYGVVAMALHWVLAMLIGGQWMLGLVMTRLESQRLLFVLVQWHKSFGFLILTLALIRLGWRLANPPPRLPSSVPRTERLAAGTAHWGLYTLMVVLPLSGWALVSTSVLAVPTLAFYLVLIPHLPLTPSERAEDFWRLVHHALAYAIGGLVAVHVLGALRHHFLLRDDVLRRMVFPARHSEGE